MQVTIEYEAQIKRAVGLARETFELADGSVLKDAIELAVTRHPETLKDHLLGDDGKVLPAILTFVDNQQVRDLETCILKDQSVITLLSPISGG